MGFDYAIIGGGVVGLSVAYGLSGLGKKIVVLDEGDMAFRASRGNFGLIWVQSKGLNEPAYARWTQKSATLWRGYAEELTGETGIELALSQEGGLHYHLSEESLASEAADYEALKKKLDGAYPYEVLGHNALKKEEPNIGPQVAGAILHHQDGHVNPLRLLRALAAGVRKYGVNLRVGHTVKDIAPRAGGFELTSSGGDVVRAERVVLSAGLGAANLGPKLGFKAPVYPQRGHVMITEKLPPIMRRPSGTLRQVDEGGVQIGASKDEVGLDDRETMETTAQLAREAVEVFPALARAKLVRSWAALRIMSPDGLPIYQESESHPGAFLVTCHSGITLSAAHAKLLPHWLEKSSNAPELATFSEARFDD
ncbi:MAG: NAD(P)/FAD-dependent oxidoreductase [Hyphomicrobiales bacterium]